METVDDDQQLAVARRLRDLARDGPVKRDLLCLQVELPQRAQQEQPALRTTAEQLRFLRFPLGDLTKTETRALARDFDLPVAEKPDSQDICFVPSGRYADVIERLRLGGSCCS